MIEVKHLVKKYGDHTAVNDLSFTLESGKIYGFLGPNGAGKSTTMNMMTGYIASTSGQILINGHDILTETEEAKKCIGYLPEIFCSLLAGIMIDQNPGWEGYRNYFGFVTAMLVIGAVLVMIWIKYLNKKKKEEAT